MKGFGKVPAGPLLASGAAARLERDERAETRGSLSPYEAPVKSCQEAGKTIFYPVLSGLLPGCAPGKCA